MQQTAPLSPEPFWEAMTGFQRSAAIKAAVELEIFTKIGEGSKTAETIAGDCSAAPRGVRILCDSLTVMGFLTKAAGEYHLTDMSAAFLDKNSPMYIGSAADFILSPMQKRGFEDLTNAVIQGGSTVKENGSLDPESPMWVKFARGMMGMMMPAAQ